VACLIGDTSVHFCSADLIQICNLNSCPSRLKLVQILERWICCAESACCGVRLWVFECNISSNVLLICPFPPKENSPFSLSAAKAKTSYSFSLSLCPLVKPF
jgi:hypothetical protein